MLPTLSLADVCDDPEILKISEGLTLQSSLCAQNVSDSLLGSRNIHLPPPVPYYRNEKRTEAKAEIFCKDCAEARKHPVMPEHIQVPMAAPVAGAVAGNSVASNSFGPITTQTITFYNLPGNITAAGNKFSRGAMRAAMPASNSQRIKAGAWYRIYNQDGKSVDVCVNDHLPSRNQGLDLTPGAFSRIAPLGAGKLQLRMQRIAEPPPGVPKQYACDSRYASWHPENGSSTQIAAARSRR